MDFLFCSILSLISSITFRLVWRNIPVRWLFDCAELSRNEASVPHPKADCLQSQISGFLLFFSCFITSIALSQNGALWDVLGGLSLFWLLGQIALSDAYYRLIPDQWSAGLAIWGFLRILLSPEAVSSRFIPLTLCNFLTIILYFLPRSLTGVPAIGLGDIKLFFALAVLLTPKEFFAVMASAAVLGGAVAAWMMLCHKLRGSSLSSGVPYGTVLFLAFLLLLLRNAWMVTPL